MTEKLGRPPIEKLSDVAWARVERGLWARMDGAGTVTAASGSRELARERRDWKWIAIPLAAAAACALVMFAARGPQAPSVGEQEPARVVSGASPSAVSFGDAHVTLDANTAIEMDHDGDKPVALLERGAAWFSVAPRGDRPPFQVRAGDTLVTVVGTRFRVARDGEHADVTVDHGAVEVRFRGRVIHLVDGQTWSSP
ncbi:MAG TPA: FecR family protein [Kofleriaceae bacterium]|jgi:transmembrane sensor